MGMREEFNTIEAGLSLPSFLGKTLVTVSHSGGIMSVTGKTRGLAVVCYFTVY